MLFFPRKEDIHFLWLSLVRRASKEPVPPRCWVGRTSTRARIRAGGGSRSRGLKPGWGAFPDPPRVLERTAFFSCDLGLLSFGIAAGTEPLSLIERGPSQCPLRGMEDISPKTLGAHGPPTAGEGPPQCRPRRGGGCSPLFPGLRARSSVEGPHNVHHEGEATVRPFRLAYARSPSEGKKQQESLTALVDWLVKVRHDA